MADGHDDDDDVICPDCKGRGLIRPPGEYHTEECDTCDGTGRVSAGRADKDDDR